MTTLQPLARAAHNTAPGFVAPSFGRGLTGQRTFAEALGDIHRSNHLDAQESRTPEARAREAAELLVSSTLVEPILKQARETNNAAPPFGPTQAEKQFGGILDHRLAYEMVSGSNFPLVDRLARDLLQKSRTTA